MERNLGNDCGFLHEIGRIWRIIFKIYDKKCEYCRFPERNHRFSVDFANLGWEPNFFFRKTAVIREEK